MCKLPWLSVQLLRQALLATTHPRSHSATRSLASSSALVEPHSDRPSGLFTWSESHPEIPAGRDHSPTSRHHTAAWETAAPSCLG